MAETRADADNAFDFFVQAYPAKSDEAVECLAREPKSVIFFGWAI